ncbi:MAG: hypothetical protein HQL88_04285 [Magnetococcales bacterium]|nr:hypothetical protein [Magnetococcales bacterium]
MKKVLLWMVMGIFWMGTVATGNGAGKPVSRTVLAFHNPSETYEESRFQPLHRWGEVILNHFGLVVHYLDQQQPLPPLSALEGVQGIVVWTESAFSNPDTILTWLEQAMEAGIRVVVLGNSPFMGDQENPLSLARRNRFWNKMGMRQDGEWVQLTYKVKVVRKDSEMVEFERPLSGLLPPYDRMSIVNGRVKSYLTVNHSEDPATASDLVAVGPLGGYVAANYAVFKNPEMFQKQWHINPILFFRQALGLERHTPAPDTSTLSGRRIFYSHIDGDGWRNLSEISPYREKNRLSAEVILKEILERYDDLPVTVAPIAGDLDPAWFGTQAAQEIARRIFALPHVELGSHTYSHPLDWIFFKDYTQAREKPFLEYYPQKGFHSMTALLRHWLLPQQELAPDIGMERIQEFLYKRKDSAETTAPQDQTTEQSKETPVEKKSTLTMGHKIPRSYGVEPFDMNKELEGAVRFTEHFAPPDKKVAIIHWSGNTHPSEESIATVRRLGLQDINGGDTRFDQEYPSLSWIAPLAREVGPYHQVYSSNSNENTYTDLWTDRFFGFRYLVHTLENTEIPWRMKPVNIYYHIYSGEKLSSYTALRSNLEYVRRQELAPITTSHFSRIVQGFFSTRMELLGEKQWRIAQRGAVQTIRFDHATHWAVDWSRSVGVVGQRHQHGSLYIALDEAHTEVVVALTAHPLADQFPAAPAPYLVDGRWRIWKLTQEGESAFTFTAQGFGAGAMNWWVPRPGLYRVTLRHAQGGWQGDFKATSAHLLPLKLPDLALNAVTVRVEHLPDAPS